MSDDEKIYVLSGLAPDQTAVRIAQAIGGYMLKDGDVIGVWRPGHTQRIIIDDVIIGVGGSVDVNEPLDLGPPGTEQIVSDYYDIKFDLWTGIADDQFLHEEAADIFNTIVSDLRWPAAHLRIGGWTYSASLPDGRRMDLPDGDSEPDDELSLWGPYMPGEAERLAAAERGRTMLPVPQSAWPRRPVPDRPKDQIEVRTPQREFAPADRRDYDLTFSVAHPGFGGRKLNMFFMPGAAFPDSAAVRVAESRAINWLDDRYLAAEIDSRRSAYGYKHPELPSFEMFRRGFEFDGRGVDGWGSWAGAEAALAGIGVADETIAVLEDAFAFAEVAHAGQVRPAGEPYTDHLLEVVQVLAEGLGSRDRDQLVAAALHDVVEDTSVTLEEVVARFGTGVAELVNWVTMPPFTPENRSETRAAYLAHLKDAPPVVRQLKLADRYSNVQRLHMHPRPEKQRSYAAETVEHFVPLTLKEKTFFLPLFLAWMRRTPVLAG